MDDLAAAVAVVAMSVDDVGMDDLELRASSSSRRAHDVPMGDEGVAGAEKENDIVLPEKRLLRAAERKVLLRPRTPCRRKTRCR